MTDTPAIRATVDAAFADLGRIDVIVNNAGYALLGAAEEVSDAQIQHQIDTNITGSIQVARAALPHLRRQGGGRIVQIASMLGQTAYPSMSVYAATKWAIEGFFEALIQEVAPFGIDAILVEPGASRTNFAGSSAVMGQIMEPYEQSHVGDFRRMLAAAGLAAFPGDPRKMAQAIIDAVDQAQAPKRLTLGSDAYAAVHQALTGRLTALESQKELAHSTDVAG